MSSATAQAVADAINAEAKRAVVSEPAVRGADVQTGTVTAVGTDGTVDIGSIRARRLESYTNPAVGDVIILARSGMGNWWAGGRTVSAADAVGSRKVALKTADTSRASNATPSDDPHLTFAVTANAKYVVDGWVKYSALTDVDLTIDWAIPSGALGEWTGHGAGLGTTAQTTSGYSIRTEANDVSQTRNFSGTDTSAELTVLIKGTLRVAGTAGTYALQWSQGTSNASATVVYTDSWVRLERIA